MFSVRIRWYIWRLKSKDSDVREAAAYALGEIGSKEAVPHLREALKDEYSDVREAAEEALGKEGIGYLELEREKLLNYLVVLHLRCF